MKAHLTDLLYTVVKEFDNDFDSRSIIIDRPKQIEHGDFSTNLSLMLSKKLKKPPREIAQDILNKLPRRYYRKN